MHLLSVKRRRKSFLSLLLLLFFDIVQRWRVCPCTSDPLRVTLSKKSVRLRNIDRQRKGGRYYIEKVRENDWSRLLAFSRPEKPNSLGDSWIRSRRRIHEFFFAARKFMDSFLVYIYPYIYIYVYICIHIYMSYVHT